MPVRSRQSVDPSILLVWSHTPFHTLNIRDFLFVYYTLPPPLYAAPVTVWCYLKSFWIVFLICARTASDIKCFEAGNGFVNYVTVDPDKYRRKTKAVKKTLSIPEWLNEEAEKKHINFSSVLQSALLSEIENR
jgi:hypothetical protein